MLKSQKSHLTCSFRDPILLPCDDSICLEHLSDKDVVKQNKIKCKECNAEYGVKNNEFKSNEDLKKLIESKFYLSEDEIRLKQDLEQLIRTFFEFYDDFAQDKTQIDLDVYNHFHELRFQVDEHRERLKEKIDEIALAMIDKI
jgi:hypothetical protein